MIHSVVCIKSFVNNLQGVGDLSSFILCFKAWPRLCFCFLSPMQKICKLKMMTEMSCHKYVSWMWVFWVLLWISHAGKAGVSYQHVTGVQRPTVGHLEGIACRGLVCCSEPANPGSVLSMPRAGQNRESVALHQSSSHAASSLFLDGWECSWTSNVSSFLASWHRTFICHRSGPQRPGRNCCPGCQGCPAKVAESLRCFNSCSFMLFQRMAPCISVLNAVFLSASQCFPVLNLILIHHSFGVEGRPLPLQPQSLHRVSVDLQRNGNFVLSTSQLLLSSW